MVNKCPDLVPATRATGTTATSVTPRGRCMRADRLGSDDDRMARVYVYTVYVRSKRFHARRVHNDGRVWPCFHMIQVNPAAWSLEYSYVFGKAIWEIILAKRYGK